MSRGIFVYGTLRTAECNHHLLRPFLREATPAVARGMALYPVTPRYPGMVEGAGNVVGEYVVIEPDRWLEALAVLDQLEVYFGPGDPANEYERRLIPVETASGVRLAHAYLWARGVDGLEPIAGGDWQAYRRSRR
jgi:gamma-glutamylcyclotransferase (GGCT)/AIG2-like uncharacterized protein YtfP